MEKELTFKIYKLNLRDKSIEASYAEFGTKDECMIYCHKLNSVETEFGSVFFYFYCKVEDNCFAEFISKEFLLAEAKKQITVRLKLIENEKSILDKANEALSDMEKEAV